MRKSFAKQIKEQRRKVREIIQLYGDMPECDLDRAITIDWIHTMMEAQATLFEELRNTENPNYRIIRKKLALIAATCVEWEKRIYHCN